MFYFYTSHKLNKLNNGILYFHHFKMYSFYTLYTFIKMLHTSLPPGLDTVNITDRSKAILLWCFLLFYVLVFKLFVLFAPHVCSNILVKFK